MTDGASARLLAALFRGTPGMRMLVDPTDGAVVDVNADTVAYFGLPRETLLSMTVLQLSEQSGPALLEDLARTARGEQGHFEYKDRLPNGETREIAVDASPIEVDGRTLLFTIIHDVSERARADEALRDARRWQQALFDGMRDAVVVCAPDGRVVDVNRQAETLLGRDRARLLELRHADLYPKERRDWVERAFAEGLSGNVPRLFEVEVEWPDGARVPVEVAACPLLLGDGRTVVLGVFRDISERQARESEVWRLSQILAQSPVAIVVTDLDARITWVNTAFTALSGFSLDEVLGQNPRMFAAGQTPPEVFAGLWAALLQGRTWRGEVSNRRKHGEVYVEAEVISPLRDASGRVTHYVAMKEDITERRRLEEDLRRAQRLEAVGQLAGGVAHDFNNLLAVQHINLSLLLRRKDLPPDVVELLRELEQGSRLAADVTRQLLAFGRRQSLKRRLVSLDALVADMMKLLARVLPESITAVHLPADGPTWVNLDSAAAEQAVMNLVVNARDAMPDGGTLTIRTTPSDNGRSVTLTVADTGVGIEPEGLPHIFEPFYSRRGDGRGTGLGLATVYGVVRQHGGVCEVRSVPGQGATFTLKFPAAPPPAEAPLAPEPKPAVGPLRVLLVEDSADVRRAVARGLAEMGHEVVEVSTGASALARWPDLRRDIDVLLTDAVMPGGLSGVQLARTLREDRADLTIIIASGYSTELTRGLEGDFHFLSKPFGFDALERILATAPSRRASRPTHRE